MGRPLTKPKDQIPVLFKIMTLWSVSTEKSNKQ